MNREELKKYKYNHRWIKGRLEYIEEYKTYLTKTTNTISDMPKGNNKIQDGMAEKITTVMVNLDELLEKIVKEQKKQKEILEQLEYVEQPYRTILEEHYVKGKTLVQVACDLKYNYEYTKKANAIGLKKFEEVKIFPKSY